MAISQAILLQEDRSLMVAIESIEDDELPAGAVLQPHKKKRHRANIMPGSAIRFEALPPAEGNFYLLSGSRKGVKSQRACDSLVIMHLIKLLSLPSWSFTLLILKNIALQTGRQGRRARFCRSWTLTCLTSQASSSTSCWGSWRPSPTARSSSCWRTSSIAPPSRSPVASPLIRSCTSGWGMSSKKGWPSTTEWAKLLPQRSWLSADYQAREGFHTRR